MKKTMMGNFAASWGAQLSRVQVIAAYPITPQTLIVEKLSEIVADGELDAEFIKVESEHSAMAACIGASATGARAYTATSAQGLALMHEMLHWAGLARMPIVMTNVNRAMAPGWSIWADQNDSLSQRDTGWMQIYASSAQEILDSTIIGYKVSEQVLLPTLISFDAFFLSHTVEVVDMPEIELVDKYLPPFKPDYKLDVNDPRSFGALTDEQYYYEFRYKMQESMNEAVDIIKDAGKEYEKLTGRAYSLIHPYRCEDADMILVTSGTIAETTNVAVDELRAEGKKVGNLRIRVIRPYPKKEILEVVKGVKKLAVIDRNISPGYSGIFSQELKSALYNEVDIPTRSYIAGLGGRDVKIEDIKDMANDALKNDTPNDLIWKGVKL
ncbi:MAG: pyruvate ferredoxin oxidoreductase [Candidatus Celaenobacter antarcticus]|nr:pyruvate ferredoxin oxidoreductase [Candidatus Celaenobacter antarcticus]MDP8313775.1 pyruvate ferredoxin oxidoreductase [Candidatus Celaenobacter antarcticus]